VTITITHNKTVGNPNLDTIKITYRSRNCLPFANTYVHLGSVLLIFFCVVFLVLFC